MSAVALCTFQLGPYLVQRIRETDLYRIFLRGVLIGKCYSMPSQSDCEWLERQQRAQTMYAYSTAPIPDPAHRWAKDNAFRRNKRSRASKV